MEISWIVPLVTVLSFHLQFVAGQFGIYFDTARMNYRYYNSMPCVVNNFYTTGHYGVMTAGYTPCPDINTCYMVATRNDCCEETSYNFVTRSFLSTCKCDPKVNCGRAPVVITTTTTTPKPTPAAPLLCPTISGRILHSLAVANTCGDYPGVFPVVRANTGRTPPTAICNVVVAQAVVNGVRKTTLVTSEFCRKIVEATNRPPSVLSIYVAPSLFIPISSLTMITGRDGAAFFDPTQAILQQLLSSCSKIACGLRDPDMVGKINYNDCHLVSYGSYLKSNLAQSGLRSVGVRIYPEGCRSVNIQSATNTLCFTTTGQAPVLCSGDYGAPVYCKAITTGENVVVGMVAGSNMCGATTSFAVVRYPTY